MSWNWSVPGLVRISTRPKPSLSNSGENGFWFMPDSRIRAFGRDLAAAETVDEDTWTIRSDGRSGEGGEVCREVIRVVGERVKVGARMIIALAFDKDASMLTAGLFRSPRPSPAAFLQRCSGRG